MLIDFSGVDSAKFFHFCVLFQKQRSFCRKKMLTFEQLRIQRKNYLTSQEQKHKFSSKVRNLNLTISVRRQKVALGFS